MTRLPIRLYGDPILRKKAERVEEIDEDMNTLARDMLETCRQIGAIGLAANQVGVAKRMLVVDKRRIDLDEIPLVLINPEVTGTQGEDTSEEGCMSLPGQFEQVKRPKKVKIKGMNLKKEEIEIEGEGLLARVLIHEIDHLNGVLFIDHLSSIRLKLLGKKLRDISGKGLAG